VQGSFTGKSDGTRRGVYLGYNDLGGDAQEDRGGVSRRRVQQGLTCGSLEKTPSVKKGTWRSIGNKYQKKTLLRHDQLEVRQISEGDHFWET